MNLYVDDVKIGKQEAGTEKTYSILLEEGNHEFYMENDGIYQTDKLSFEVYEEDQIFAFGAKTRLTFGVELWNKINS